MNQLGIEPSSRTRLTMINRRTKSDKPEQCFSLYLSMSNILLKNNNLNFINLYDKIPIIILIYIYILSFRAAREP